MSDEQAQPPSELSLATMEELLNELFGRFDHLVVAGIIDKSYSDYGVLALYRGLPQACYGLAATMMTRLNDDMIDAAEESGETPKP